MHVSHQPLFSEQPQVDLDMLFFLGERLESVWGPFRLLTSHIILLSAGTMLSALLVWALLPKLWNKLPRDGGKAFAADGGKNAKGKPTGAGVIITLLSLPVIALFVPMDWLQMAVVLCLYLSMLFGFLDDRSVIPWSRCQKGVLDLLISGAAALCIYYACGSELWLPFVKHGVVVPLYLYLPLAVGLLWVTTNATNCSDGVDGLAGPDSALALCHGRVALRRCWLQTSGGLSSDPNYDQCCPLGHSCFHDCRGAGRIPLAQCGAQSGFNG